MMDEKCKHCEDREATTYDGYCAWCRRKATIVFSQRENGYQCSLCLLAGEQTRLSLDDREKHLREVHNTGGLDKKATLREYERIMAIKNRAETQENIEAFA